MTITHEVHPRDCRCSYCYGWSRFARTMTYGLNVPPGWRSPHAWWVVKYAPGRYLRWTWPRALFPRHTRTRSRT